GRAPAGRRRNPMISLRSLMLRLRALVRRDAVERELEEELRFHLEMEAEERVRGGATPAQAWRDAAIAFGGVERIKEEYRDERGVRGLVDVVQDARYALRVLARSPGFAVVAVLTLALGIGANTAIFSVVDAVLLEPLPYADPDRLVMVWQTDRVSGTEREPASVPDYFDVRERSRVFEELAAFAWAYGGLLGEDGEPVRVKVAAATRELLPMLGVRPVVGRLFTAADDSRGETRVALLSEGLWRSRFGSDPAIVGRVVDLDGEAYTVVGVVPSRVEVPIGVPVTNAPVTPDDTDVWLPFRLTPTSGDRSQHDVLVVARLGPGVPLEAAQTDAARIASELEAEL